MEFVATFPRSPCSYEQLLKETSNTASETTTEEQTCKQEYATFSEYRAEQEASTETRAEYLADLAHRAAGLDRAIESLQAERAKSYATMEKTCAERMTKVTRLGDYVKELERQINEARIGVDSKSEYYCIIANDLTGKLETEQQKL